MKALLMDQKDNVAVVLEKLENGNTVDILLGRDVNDSVAATAEIPFGHKIATRDIEADDPVMKYGEVIGRATQSIPKGAHVHIQNVVSIRGSAKQE